MAAMDKVISSNDVTAGAVLVLTGQFDPKVHIMNDVLFDQDSGATVYVNTIGRFIIANALCVPGFESSPVFDT
jgi:hypothetical protein